MRKLCIPCTLVLSVLFSSIASAQDFSNKGKDFWVGYGYHQVMTTGNGQQMVLYFAAEQNSNVTVSIPANGYVQNYFVPAGSVVTSAPIPKTGPQDSRLMAEGYSNNGIHITSDKGIVAYAHIYNQNVSGATILYPTNTLGKEYYSVNYTNISNTGAANCWFYVVAADTGTTTVEITPSANTVAGWIAGSTYTLTLTQGQIYNVMGTYSGNSGVDLSGSVIRSRNNGSGCKKIGVFSGSGRISITCTGAAASSDNYMVQAMPKAAWGKKYLTTPTSPNMSYGFYRVCVSDPSTVVTHNGAPIAVPLTNNFYYEIGPTNIPHLFEADKPIMVSQYITSQGHCSNGSPGDPEVIYLSPVEQNINKVLWNATPNYSITQHYINVVIKNSGTALTSFTLDGVPIPPAAFVPHPSDPAYSFLFTAVTSGQHQIFSDSGFNAIAYGYGNYETYGYNAGTNIRDLFQFVNIKNLHGTVNFPATCRSTPFKLSMVFPYQPTQIDWVFGPLLNAMGFVDTTLLNPVADSSWIVAGRTIYQYRLPRTYSVTSIGTYPIKVIATNPTPDGCGNLQEIDFDLEVFEPPVADFTFNTNGCFNSPVDFFDNSNTSGRPVISRFWNFADGNTSNVNNPSHTYAAPGSYAVKYTLITDVGCLADTVTHTVNLDPLPTAQFSVANPVCPNVPVTFTDLSTAAGTSMLAQWTWDFGDGSPVVVRNTSTNEVHTYITPGTYNATLRVETSTGCESTLFTFPITVQDDGTVFLSSAPGTDNQTVCINTAITNISYAVGGSSNGGSVSGLPAGVSGSYAGGIITITGTPTVSGTFTYTVSTSGPCVNPTTTGTITVTQDGTITLSSAPGSDNQTVCINTAISNITYSVGGSGTGGSVSGLPAGVTGVFAGAVITISGTPSVSGTFNYSVVTTGPCVTPSATGTITVTPDGTVSLSSAPGTDNQTVCINTAITNITYAVGGSSNGGSVSGLPAGVSGSYAGGVISIFGTPTVSGTFTYTVSTTGPCVNPTITGTITVTQDGSVTLSSAPGTDNQTVCINAAIAAITYTVGGSGIGGSVTGLPAGVTGVYAGGMISITGTPTVSGTFNYTVLTTGPCITPSATGTITVTPDGTLSLTSAPGTNNQSVCINTAIVTITYSVGGSGTGGNVTGLPPGITGTYAGGVISISGSPTSVLGSPFTYTVNTTGPCVNPTATGTITVNPDATIALSSAPGTDAQELCMNSAITAISYNIGGGGSGATVSGLPAGVTGSFAGGVFTIGGSPSASGLFTYIVQTTGTCVQTSATGTILVNALPTANYSSSTPSCEFGVISFTDLSVPNSGNIISWSWDFGDGGTSTLQNPTHTYGAAGTYNVTLVVTTDKGCISINSVTPVTIYDKPAAGFIIPEVCLNDTYAQFTDTSSVPVPDNIVSWSWDFGDGGTSTLQNPQHSYTAVGSYNVRLMITTNRGCKDTIDQSVFVNGSYPQAGFTVQNLSALCANDSISIVEASTVFPGTITKVEIYWDNAGLPGVYDTDPLPYTGKIYKHLYPNFQNPLTKSFTIRYRAYSGGVCVDDSLFNITVNAAPKVQFNPIPPICLDATPYQITQATETGGVPGSGMYSGPGVTPGGLFTPSIAGPGTHTIKYLYTSSAAGCVDSLTQTIKVWEPATADFTVSAPVCERQPVTFTDISTATEGTLTQWQWDFSDGTPVVIQSSGVPFTHSFSGWGTFQVKLRVVTSNGCVSTEKIIPVDVKPLARPNFTFPAASCLPNADVPFTNASNIPDGTQSSFSYLWNFGDPGSGVVNTSTGSNPSHTYVSTGPFNVNLQVTTGAGCIHDTTIIVNTIHPEPAGSFTTDKVDVCVGGDVRFTSTSNPLDGSIVSWHWDMDDGNSESNQSFNYTYALPRQYSVKHYIINSFGCKSTIAFKTVSINPYPPVNAGPDKLMLEGGQVTLTPSQNASMPVTYSWSPATYLSNPNIAEPVATPPDDITYILTVTTDKGCSDSDDVFIKVLKKPDIPNIFSPNGDGVHDIWEIKYLETYPGCTVEVVNRYGQLVFRSVGYATPWDGKINGKDAPVGTYYYVVNPKNGRKPITGYVEIIR